VTTTCEKALTGNKTQSILSNMGAVRSFINIGTLKLALNALKPFTDKGYYKKYGEKTQFSASFFICLNANCF
jgi:hypothetical protein